jgi:flagellin
VTVSLGSNISSLKAQRRLNDTSNSLSNSFERLSSGLRINRASDDAAGLAIASTLNAQARIFGQGVRNLNDAVSLLNIAEGATQELSAILTRIKELATQSANGIYSDNQRTASNTEVQALRSEFVRITQTTKFNGVSLLDGKTSAITIQAGGNAPAGQGISIGVTGFGSESQDSFLSPVQLSIAFNPIMDAFAADLTNDGIQDLVFLANNRLEMRRGNGDGTFVNQFATISAFGADVFTFFDYNSDTYLDIYATDTRFGNTYVILNNAGISLSLGATIAETYGTTPSAYDFNSDGVEDNILFNGRFYSVGLGAAASLPSFSVATRSDALTTIEAAETTLSSVITQRGQIGSQQSRLQIAANNLSQAKENFLAAESRIRDADVASEAANLIKNQILQQAGAAVLAQANQAPALALSLLRGS